MRSTTVRIPLPALYMLAAFFGGAAADLAISNGGLPVAKPSLNASQLVNGAANLSGVIGGIIGSNNASTAAVGSLPGVQGSQNPTPPIVPVIPASTPQQSSGQPGNSTAGSELAPAPGLLLEDPYLFGVYQTTGTGLGASVYTGNRTVQYTGVRNPDGSPANLTELSYIILGARTDILVNTPLGSAATLSTNNGSLVVGYPTISGTNITVGYTLSDYTTGRTVVFNISVPSNRYSSGAGQGRRLLQNSPCSQIADRAAAFCETISIPDELYSTITVNYAQEVEEFIQDQLDNMRAGSVIYVGAYAGATAAAVADAAASIAIIGVEVYAGLGVACLVRSGAAFAANYADFHPCSPQQGGCDDNGADDSC